jgi:hypothetical protein
MMGINVGLTKSKTTVNGHFKGTKNRRTKYLVPTTLANNYFSSVGNLMQQALASNAMFSHLIRTLGNSAMTDVC